MLFQTTKKQMMYKKPTYMAEFGIGDEVYSGTSEERTLWEWHFCPLFRGCPLLGGCLIFALYPPLDMVVYYIHEIGEVSDDTV